MLSLFLQNTRVFFSMKSQDFLVQDFLVQTPFKTLRINGILGLRVPPRGPPNPNHGIKPVD